MVRKQYLYTLLLALGFSHTLFAQPITIVDDFADSNFTSSPQWLGDTGKFKVNANKQLQLDDPQANAPAQLLLNSPIILKATWEFWIKMDFAPSSSNYAKVYLTSSNQDLTKSANGYYLKIGGISGTADNISLYRQDGNSSTLLIDGIDSTVGLAPAESKIKVTKDSIGEWELLIDTSVAGNTFVSQGKAIDQTHLKSSYFGILCHYTTTRSDKFYFDNFSLQGEAFKDTIKPELQNITVADSLTLSLAFSKLMDPITAKDTNNYIVGNSFGKPKSVDFIGNDSTKVQLTFSKSFDNGKGYYLKVENVQDQANNIIRKDSLEFLYFVPASANRRDVAINEFYPDESASNGLVEAEFIELFNASNKIFDLANWKISDASTTQNIPSFIFRAGEYVILCSQSDSSKFAKYGKVVAVSSLPTLNNNGDLIRLENDSNKTIDELTYDKSWYGDNDKSNGGWTIEQINPFTPCSGKKNFIASIDSIGGTPGKINSQFNTAADTTPPKLLDAKVLSSFRVILYFDEPIDSNSINGAKYTFNSNAVVDTAIKQVADDQSILLQLSVPLDSGKINSLTIEDIFDCPGNPIGKDNSIDLIVPIAADFRDIVINEIYVNTKNSNGLPEAPFIEIYNASENIFQLKDWTIGNGSKQGKLDNQILQSGEYLILCSYENKAAYSKYGRTDGLSNFPSITQSEDEIFLIDDQGKLIDYIHYTEDWYKDEKKKKGGWSIAQINPQKKCNGADNFAASTARIGGSPAAVNSIFSNQKDSKPPQLLNTLVYSSDSIKLIFDEGIDETTVDLNDFIFSNNNTVKSISFAPFVFHSFFLILDRALDSGKVVELSIQNISDCAGNEITASKQNIALPEKATKEDIVINEILFNPYSGGNDFVEVYNRSNKIIDLRNWEIANGTNLIADNKQTISELPTVFFPGEYFVLTENQAAVKRFYSKAVTKNFILLKHLPPYNNDKGEVFLFDASDSLIDHISYLEEMHFELLKSVKGVSLERINPNVASDAADNFHSAAESEDFATPGYQNSQYSLTTTFKGEVNISPETFSPNNDGYQDWLNINYQFPKNGYVANLSIYDQQGRLILKLVNNELLGKKGSFKWDGLTKDKSKAPIGIYLIYFEVFNTKGDKEAFKKTAVLAN